MGGAVTCLSRSEEKEGFCCGGRHGEHAHGEDEGQEELRVAHERDRLLTVVEEGDDEEFRCKIQRFYSVQEFDDLMEFRKSYYARSPMRQNTLVHGAYGPWGVGTARGGDKNAWDDLDAMGYMVRSATYLSDRKKEHSGPALAELVVVDMFMSETDIERVARCEAARTVQRARRGGEHRRLLVLNFRVVPLHVVIVWALPEGGDKDSNRAQALLSRFVKGMTDQERNARLKVIPRVITGPWPIRKLVGENSPAILGRGIPVTYHEGPDELEVSVSIAASAAAQRVSRALLRAGSALHLELAVLLEGQSTNELPEQVLGGFRMAHPDLSTLRQVDPDTAEEVEDSPSLARPAFLPTG